MKAPVAVLFGLAGVSLLVMFALNLDFAHLSLLPFY